jgi:16S rRNA processing protein RimM
VGRAPDYLVVGHLSKPHGTRGELMIWPLTDRPDEVFVPGRRLVLGTETGEVSDPRTEVAVTESRPFRRGVLVRLEGVESRTAAEALVARYVLLAAEELGEPGEDELYYHQLLGLMVVTQAGDEVGRVREVYETEPHHLLEIRGAERVHLVPFSREIVRMVDLEAGRLVIEPPEGLLEL